MKIAFILGLAFAIFFSGAADCFGLPSKEQILLTSSPNNANVTLYNPNNELLFTSSTPLVFELRAFLPIINPPTYRLEMSKEGHENTTVEIIFNRHRGWMYNDLTSRKTQPIHAIRKSIHIDLL